MRRPSVFERLNPAQRAAACFGGRGADGRFTAGPLLIIAGAGTGKTNTLAHRVAHLVLKGVSPERILLLTFTRRAAQEMTRRAQTIVAAALGKDSADAPFPSIVKLPWSGTFHSIANRLVRRYALRVGFQANFTVLDQADAADLMDMLRYELGLAKLAKRFPRKATCLAIYSHRVNTQCSLAETLASSFPWCTEWEEELTQLYRAYVGKKLAHQALDFDDLLLYWHAMLSEPSLGEEISALFDQILVDEYQDTNRVQAEILKALRPMGSGLTVVGDDAQSIYSFRAAAVANILDFPLQYTPAATVLPLEQNYRSMQGILDAANALISEGQRQYRKTLKATAGLGERPRYVTVADDQSQAEYVVMRVLEAREQGVALRRQAVLFRSSHHSDTLEVELVRRNIPFVKYGGLKFLEAAHVKDLLAVLRWADNPKNQVSAFRVLQLLPRMGPAGAARCFRQFEAAGHTWPVLASSDATVAACPTWAPFVELMCLLTSPATPWHGQVGHVREWFKPHLERLYEAAEARADDLLQLEQIAEQFATRERFLSELALDPPQASSDFAGAPLLDEDYLVLSTVHSAKGREWNAVYVLSVADGNFPSEFATGQADLIEEERRVLYVAMTRAKHHLHLIAPLRYYITRQPRYGDGHVYGARSRFMSDAVLGHFEQVTWPKADAEPAPANKPISVNLAKKLRSLW